MFFAPSPYPAAGSATVVAWTAQLTDPVYGPKGTHCVLLCRAKTPSNNCQLVSDKTSRLSSRIS